MPWKNFETEKPPTGEEVIMYGLWEGTPGHVDDQYKKTLGTHRGAGRSDKFSVRKEKHVKGFTPLYWIEIEALPPEAPREDDE